jgi:hypothetical protein
LDHLTGPLGSSVTVGGEVCQEKECQGMWGRRLRSAPHGFVWLLREMG